MATVLLNMMPVRHHIYSNYVCWHLEGFLGSHSCTDHNKELYFWPDMAGAWTGRVGRGKSLQCRTSASSKSCRRAVQWELAWWGP